MPSDDLKALRKSMEDRLGELRLQIAAETAEEAGEHYRDIAGEVVDAGDEAVGAELAGLENALIGRNVGEVRDLEAALQRLAHGSYGRCADCQGEIERARLKVNPTCTRCQPCQRVHERTYAGGAHSSL